MNVSGSRVTAALNRGRTVSLGSAEPSGEEGAQQGAQRVRTPNLAREPERLLTDGAGGDAVIGSGGRGIGQPAMERQLAPGSLDRGRDANERPSPAAKAALPWRPAWARQALRGGGSQGGSQGVRTPGLARDFRPVVADG